MKEDKLFIVGFITPCILVLSVMYLYPVIRTVIMSFFKIESVTSSVLDWSLNSPANYAKVFSSSTFQRITSNTLIIWVLGGIVILSLALLFSVIITSEIRFKKFFRAATYLPNIISAMALATMRIQYIYNQDYGFINQILRTTGLEGKSWLGTDMKLWAMLAVFTFGAVGYHMLILTNGIEQTPADTYEAATTDGVNKVQQFGRITMPLFRGTFKTDITLQSVNCATFYLWSKMFSPVSMEASTITPAVYLYDTIFGAVGNVQRNADTGVAIGVVMVIFIGIVYFLMNKLLKDDDLEH